MNPFSVDAGSMTVDTTMVRMRAATLSCFNPGAAASYSPSLERRDNASTMIQHETPSTSVRNTRMVIEPQQRQIDRQLQQETKPPENTTQGTFAHHLSRLNRCANCFNGQPYLISSEASRPAFTTSARPSNCR